MKSLRVQDVNIRTPDGLLLDGTLRRRPESSRGIILCHGMTVGRDEEGILVRSERLLNHLGFSTLRFDFRAHGRSGGEPIRDFTVSGQLRDLRCACRYMQDSGLDVEGIVAASFGASIAAIYAGRFSSRLEMLVLANPVLSYRHTFLDPDSPWARRNFLGFRQQLKRQGFVGIQGSTFQIGPRFFREIARYDPAHALGRYRGHLLIIHGDRDTKVSYLHSVRCFDELLNPKKTLRIVEGAEHGFHTEPYESRVTDMICEYVRETLSAPDR